MRFYLADGRQSGKMAYTGKDPKMMMATTMTVPLATHTHRRTQCHQTTGGHIQQRQWHMHFKTTEKYHRRNVMGKECRNIEAISASDRQPTDTNSGLHNEHLLGNEDTRRTAGGNSKLAERIIYLHSLELYFHDIVSPAGHVCAVLPQSRAIV